MQVAKATEDASNMALFRLSTLFGANRSKLTSLEGQVLAAVSAQLSPAAREIFDKQLELVNLVQRHADGKDVNLYAMRRGKPFIESQFLFPLMAEAQLAAAEITTGGEQKRFTADVWLANGCVFSIEFNRSPQKIIEHGLKVASVRILCDPMISASERGLSNAEQRGGALARIQSKLPDEYLQTVGGGKGASINEWAVCALPVIRKVAQRDGNYYLLAEKVDMGAIGIKEDDFSGQLYYLDYGGGRGEKITVGLRKFLEEFDGGKVDGRF
jgi:hypothetical protein